MTGAPQLHTARLVLRRWHAADRPLFAAMNADPRVMEHFPATLAPAESDQMVDRVEAGLAEQEYGLWALELRQTGDFLGFTGLNPVRFDAHFTPAVEIGWRLAYHAWGQGFATEAARAVLAYGFTRGGLTEIVSFTSVRNVRSQAVMRRLGMTYDPDGDFEHPNLPPGHPIRRHVLYRLLGTQWAATRDLPA